MKTSEARMVERLGLDPKTTRELKKLVTRIQNARPPPVPPEIEKVTGLYEPERKGVAELDLFYTTEREARIETLKAAANAEPNYSAEPGLFTRLTVNGQLMMTDAPMERRTNIEVVRRAHGEVLIGGLGLGMIVLPIVRKKEVKRVLVVEKYKDVVDLIEPRLRTELGALGDKLAITIDDILTGELPKRGSPQADSFLFDVIYFDIWPVISTNNLRDMQRLRRRFKPFLKKDADAWMGAWLEEDLKKKRRKHLRQAGPGMASHG